MNRILLRWVVTMSLCLSLAGCETVPLTGRQALSLVSSSEIASMADQQYVDVLKKAKLSTDQAKVQMVKRVGARVSTAATDFMTRQGREADLRDFKWEFNLIQDDKTVNAWCMPGGKVAVYTGILPLTKDETGLAVVVSHEVAHALARHGDERMSQGLLVQLGGIGLSLALSSEPAATQQIFMSAYGIGSNVGFLLPYSRVQESEADRIGLSLMAMAGYDPRAAVPLWERMNEKGSERSPEWLSTHPAPASRIENIRALMPEALQYYKK